MFTRNTCFPIGSQLVCEDMTYSFTDLKQKLYIDYGTQYIMSPVGAHYVHGKVKRKLYIDYGYPKYLLPDPGSQLVKGCEDMTYSFTDVEAKIVHRLWDSVHNVSCRSTLCSR